MNRARVLLADDHRGTAELLKNLIARDFEMVAVVEDGLALVEAGKTLQPDVIVADISMPRLDGMGALAELMAEPPPREGHLYNHVCGPGVRATGAAGRSAWLCRETLGMV